MPQLRPTWILELVFLISLPCIAQAAGMVEVFTEPYRVIDLAAAEAGILHRIGVQQGDTVTAGDIVATLDQDVLLAALAIAKVRADATAALRSAEADLRLKARRFDKLKKLHDEGHASEEEIESAQANQDIAKAGVSKVKEDLQLARLEIQHIEAQLRRRTLVSPVTGQVIALHKDQGEYVAITEPVVATLVQLDRLRVKFYIDTAEIAHLRPGTELRLELPDSNQHAVGKVEFVSPTTDADSRTVRVEVVIDNVTGKYRSGVLVTIAP